MITQCLLVTAIAAVAISVPVTQEEYARYISQQQAQLSEEKQPDKGLPVRRPIQLVPSSGDYQLPATARSAYQQPATAYQPQAVAQPLAYQPSLAYQQQAYAQSLYQSPQTYQQPEEYQQPEQPYQPPVRAQAARPKATPKPKTLNRPEKPEDEEYDNNPNAQYQFSFDVNDDESTNYHNRKEQRDGQKISGSYSIVDSDGFIRKVTYTADPEEGFKAEVVREPTNIQIKIPTPAPQTASPAPQYRLPEKKLQPQYIAVQAGEPESAEQPTDSISGYYRAVPQQVRAPTHRFSAAPKPQQAGKASALGYAVTPTNSPIYQLYQQ